MKVSVMPGIAMIGLIALPILYYVIMAFIAIPPVVAPSNHDHALHQLGMPVLALIGYLIGLVISLGGDIRTISFLVQPRKK